jgi:methionine-rich copper-binding protein CopC
MKKFAILLVALLMVPVYANAHAGVVATSPSQDQVVTTMPTEVSVTFSEELLEISDKEVNTLTVADPDGALIENLNHRVEGPTLIATLPAADNESGEYPSGLYTVNYRVVSADGHEVTDSYTFSLNAPMLLATESAAQEGGDQEGGDGVIPLPILIAILTLLVAGGILLIRLRKR